MATQPSAKWKDCSRQTFAGATLGSVTGILAGGVQGLTALPNPAVIFTNATVQSAVVKQAAAAGALIGLWSAVFQASRCFMHRPQWSAEANIASATLITAPLLVVPAFRRNIPWALALVSMDWYHGGLGQKKSSREF